jgi:hypothetical protein
MATAESLRAQVRIRLEEAVEAVWNDDAIDEFVRGALSSYSWTYPREVATDVAVAEGETSVPFPASTRQILRVIQADGSLIRPRGYPAHPVPAEALAWEPFAGLIHFSQALPAQTLTVWRTAAVTLDTLPADDEEMVVLDAVYRLLQARAIQEFKRGGPLSSSSYDAVIARAHADYEFALGLRRRRVRSVFMSN